MNKKYDELFVRDALKYRADHPELSVAAVCRNLGVSVQTYYGWARANKNGETQESINNSKKTIDEKDREILRLRKQLDAERDALRILKKAIGILGNEPK